MKKHERIIAEVEKIIPEVYLVGGSVRDLILGVEPHDYDFTTPLSPDEVEALVKKAGRKCYSIGKKFGTIGFKVQYTDVMQEVNPDGTWEEPYEVTKFEYVEVTTFRTEQYDGKSRKPEVQFVDDLLLDLSRRDLTINAIALRNGEYIDPFGGRLDILAKKIKAVGKGKERFKEDPLRMLRVARFAAKLGFDVDPNLIGDMKACGKLIYNVSKERWVIELDKLLECENIENGMEVLMNSGLMKFVLPEVWLSWKNSLGFLAFMDAIEKGGYYDVKSGVKTDSDSLNERWRYLLYHIGYPYARTEKKGEYKFPQHELIRKELLQGICFRLKFSNERSNYLLNK